MPRQACERNLIPTLIQRLASLDYHHTLMKILLRMYEHYCIVLHVRKHVSIEVILDK